MVRTDCPVLDWNPGSLSRTITHPVQHELISESGMLVFIVCRLCCMSGYMLETLRCDGSDLTAVLLILTRYWIT